MICLFSLSCIYYPEYKWLVNAYSVNKLLSVTLACYYSLLIRLMSLKKVRYKYWGVVLPPIPHPPPPQENPNLNRAQPFVIPIPSYVFVSSSHPVSHPILSIPLPILPIPPLPLLPPPSPFPSHLHPFYLRVIVSCHDVMSIVVVTTNLIRLMMDNIYVNRIINLN